METSVEKPATTTNKIITLKDINPKGERIANAILSNFKFKMFSLFKLPLAFFAGLRVDEITPEKCVTSVPHKWLNQNPFKSMYFAVQCMAGELSTGVPGLLASQDVTPKTAMLVSQVNSSYSKKAKTRITFTCNDVQKIWATALKARETGQWETVTAETIGRDKDGDEVSRFQITWSFRCRV